MAQNYEQTSIEELKGIYKARYNTIAEHAQKVREVGKKLGRKSEVPEFKPIDQINIPESKKSLIDLILFSDVNIKLFEACEKLWDTGEGPK